MIKRFLSKLLIFTIFTSAVVSPTTVSAEASTNIKTGDYIQMGTYYGEPILWRCVGFEKIAFYDDEGNPVMDANDTSNVYKEGYLPIILSDKILCIKPFDAAGTNLYSTHYSGEDRTVSGSNCWNDSNLRSWLNSDASAGNVEWLCGNPPTADKVEYNAYADEAGFKTNFTAEELAAVETAVQETKVDYYDWYPDGYTKRNDSIVELPLGVEIDEIDSSINTDYFYYDTDDFFILSAQQTENMDEDILGKGYYLGEPTAECVENSEYKCNNKNSVGSPSLTEGCKWFTLLRNPWHSSASQVEFVESLCQDSKTGNYYNCVMGVSSNRGNCGVRPAFYLSDDVELTGSGTRLSPYTIS
ncbi:MAG: DUF6273 domain-containing protein [Eubacterium sp.]|nr:DUF6273 domain-containing protein [Eubacterium sp.]